MIYKNTIYGNTEDVTVAHFGEGTISITNGGNESHKCIAMKSINKHKIGECIGGEISSDEFKPELVIAFTNKESFDIFYEYVEEIKKQFT
jgi:hypothetical protein